MKKILITGVNGGMGHAVAACLAEKGYEVFGLDLQESCDLPIRYYGADLCSEEQVRRAYEKICGETDELYAVLHFVGRYVMHSLVEISEADFMRTFDVNLFATYRVNKTFLPLLRAGGKIVLTSSELAPLDPLPFTGLYAITKTAVEKYADSLRMELNLLGIDVSVIRPGAVNTNMLGSSVAAMEKLCRETALYTENTCRFRNIVESVETKKIDPKEIARIADRILRARRPKYVYNINRNAALRLLSVLPKRWQVALIAAILRGKKKKKGDVR